MDQKRFEEAKRKIIGVDRQRLGIGTLSEKTVHAIFKDYYEPDEDHQEIPIENYVADIYRTCLPDAAANASARFNCTGLADDQSKSTEEYSGFRLVIS